MPLPLFNRSKKDAFLNPEFNFRRCFYTETIFFDKQQINRIADKCSRKRSAGYRFYLPLSLWKLRTMGLLFTSHTYIPESVGFAFFITSTQTSPPFARLEPSSSETSVKIKKQLFYCTYFTGGFFYWIFFSKRKLKLN